MANDQAHDTRGNSVNRLAQAVGLNVAARAAQVAGELSYIFSDDFSSGDKLKEENGFFWSGGVRSTVSTLNPRSSTHSIRSVYNARADENSDSWTETRFNLGILYKEIDIQFDLYVPDGTEPWGGAAYYQEDAPGPDNNKLFRLWGSGGRDNSNINSYTQHHEKIGASLWPEGNGQSRTQQEWNRQAVSIGAKGPSSPGFIASSDLGKWMTIRFYARLPTELFADDADSDGFYKTYKNGTLILDNPLNNYSDGYDHGWVDGYVLGWANTGFVEETIMFLDNFVFKGIAK